MSLPAPLTLRITRGEPVHVRASCWRDPEKLVPADLDRVIAAAEIRRGTARVAPLACAIDGSTIDVSLGADATATLPPSGLTWDLELRHESGEVRTVLAGSVVVLPPPPSDETAVAAAPLDVPAGFS